MHILKAHVFCALPKVANAGWKLASGCFPRRASCKVNIEDNMMSIQEWSWQWSELDFGDDDKVVDDDDDDLGENGDLHQVAAHAVGRVGGVDWLKFQRIWSTLINQMSNLDQHFNDHLLLRSIFQEVDGSWLAEISKNLISSDRPTNQLSNLDQHFNDHLLLRSIFYGVDVNLSIEVSPKYGNVCVRARNKAYLGIR